MHILVPIHSFEPGGVERVALRLARAWTDEGHRVTVVLGRAEGVARDEAPALDYVVYPEPIRTAAWETVWLVVSLLRYLWSERPDVIFCPGNSYTVVCVLAKLLLAGRCPPVLAKISNDLDPRFLPPPARPFYRLWLRIQGKLLDRFAAIAEPMRRPAVRLLGVTADRVEAIADPAMTQREFSRLSQIERRAGSPPHIVAAGRLVPQKNFALLLAAFERLRDRDARLTIAGEGPQRGMLEKTIDRLELGERVTLAGHVDDLPKLLATADLLALSSDYEGAPAVVIEALAAGLPIAATRCCASMNWLLGGGRFGTLARLRSPRSLAHAIEWCLQMDRQPREARAHAAPFVLERGARAYLDAFQALLSRSGVTPVGVAPGH